MSAHANSAKVIVLALAANAGIAVAKFAGAFFSGSASMLAEAIHSTVDCANQILLLIGNKRSQRPATPQYPLGFGREAFFWSFIVAILLFSLGGLFAIYEGVHKLSAHEEVSSPFLGLGILFVAIILEGMSFYACIKEVKAQNTYGSLWTWFHKTTSSELLVVFTEDAAAMLGLVLAAIALTLAWVTGNSMWDAAGSIAVGTLLVVVAVLLAIEIKSLLIGEAPATDFKGFIEAKMAVLIPGGRVFHLIALQIGAQEVMLSCKLSPGQLQDTTQLVDAINTIERDLKARFPEVKWSFFEPDLKD